MYFKDFLISLFLSSTYLQQRLQQICSDTKLALYICTLSTGIEQHIFRLDFSILSWVIIYYYSILLPKCFVAQGTEMAVAL